MVPLSCATSDRIGIPRTLRHKGLVRRYADPSFADPDRAQLCKTLVERDPRTFVVGDWAQVGEDSEWNGFVPFDCGLPLKPALLAARFGDTEGRPVLCGPEARLAAAGNLPRSSPPTLGCARSSPPRPSSRVAAYSQAIPSPPSGTWPHCSGSAGRRCEKRSECFVR